MRKIKNNAGFFWCQKDLMSERQYQFRKVTILYTEVRLNYPHLMEEGKLTVSCQADSSSILGFGITVKGVLDRIANSQGQN